MTADEFKNIFLPCHQQLYRVAFKLTGTREEAEDIVQETYLKVWNCRDRLDELQNPTAFCIATLKNVFIDSIRKNHLDYESDSGVNMATLEADGDVGQEIESRDALGKLIGLIERLPANQRIVMKMRDVADLPFEEIQAATGLSPGNIRTLLSRARKKIKEQFIALLEYEQR